MLHEIIPNYWLSHGTRHTPFWSVCWAYKSEQNSWPSLINNLNNLNARCVSYNISHLDCCIIENYFKRFCKNLHCSCNLSFWIVWFSVSQGLYKAQKEVLDLLIVLLLLFKKKMLNLLDDEVTKKNCESILSVNLFMNIVY